MGLDYRHEPLPPQWPGKQRPSYHRRKRAPFKQTWYRTEDILERELRHLRATAVIIHLDVAKPARDLRFDGKLRADARPQSPKVILSFKDKNGDRQMYPCDTFADWQANLHAIAVSLEALRKVERYEVVFGGKQYEGFKRLPGSAESTEPEAMTPNAASDIIAAFSDLPARLIFEESAVAKVAIQQAMRRSHPDSGGNTESFQRVEAAARIINARHAGPR